MTALSTTLKMSRCITPPRTREHSPQKKAQKQTYTVSTHVQSILSDWRRLQKLRGGSPCIIDGNTLEIADIVGVAKYGSRVLLSADPKIHQKIDDSVQTLKKHLEGGHLVYGVNTGFGGSADTRTTDFESLQRALVQHQNSGVLTSADISRAQRSQDLLVSTPAYKDFDIEFDRQSQPTAWVRASMLTRCNSLIRGHSAVRSVIAETILALLHHEITPIVPLRGSISASGDLSPLSYIAGAIEGNPDIYVRCGEGLSNVKTADQALRDAGIEPVVLHAKEGLGLLNGTAFSAATGALAIHQASELMMLSQVLTAMGTEAMLGTAESFYPKIAEMRPHPGQIESAANILAFLSDSRLAQCVNGPKDTNVSGLYQDRYALRTSTQWIGPQIEDLLHAQIQIQRELNSTTDNPLVDTDDDRILHGGNFQAAVITSTMDRARLGIEKIGRMLFAQATEMINPSLNKGLPANLSSDDPATSYTCKGVDINMAAYASELGFLANPVGSHVMSAEMHNQAINSLALISSRYTFQALDTLRIMSAAYIFTVCQALDLRVLQAEFLKIIEHDIRALVAAEFDLHHSEETLSAIVYNRIAAAWSGTNTLNLSERCSNVADSLVVDIVHYFVKQDASSRNLSQITSFTSQVKKMLEEIYDTVRSNMYADHMTITPQYLGMASRTMYNFVRSDLGLRFHRGLVEHPTQPAPQGMSSKQASRRTTIGSQISIIYEALRDGHFTEQLVSILEAGVPTCD